ncbi:hypothetical protein BN11_650009 [Nostocoides australiense Ben110]|uniref:Uncharacterized protein n=1 Tax=Nostocoides australiense Ben110 TaxID=1193182 RepID=W6K2H4_9MICO|nr:hypothetical protein [Tetrasphaera australiensis]MCA0291375.1 hypothetical protein [Actinomycetota bacterium]CCH75336.1 hypothetical protein BN11_650009 [Tetrasphaera australiensis Ben110]HRY11869.1 hypothetical protein [Candidatus Nanopelagicales bacterium]
MHTGVFEEENGEAKEGLSTKVADGDIRLAFDIDGRFTAATDPGSEVAIKVTFWDAGGPFRVVAADYASDPVTPGGQDA